MDSSFFRSFFISFLFGIAQCCTSGNNSVEWFSSVRLKLEFFFFLRRAFTVFGFRFGKLYNWIFGNLIFCSTFLRLCTSSSLRFNLCAVEWFTFLRMFRVHTFGFISFHFVCSHRMQRCSSKNSNFYHIVLRAWEIVCIHKCLAERMTLLFHLFFVCLFVFFIFNKNKYSFIRLALWPCVRVRCSTDILCECVACSRCEKTLKCDISIIRSRQHVSWQHVSGWCGVESPSAIPTWGVFVFPLIQFLNVSSEYVAHIRRILFLPFVFGFKTNTVRNDPIFFLFSLSFCKDCLIIFIQLIILEQIITGWVCCMPCVWLRTSATVHKIALTAATLLVTSLLVASPVLFLLSTAPSQLPKDCNSKNDFNCLPTRSPAPECNTVACRTATMSMQARINWKVDPCKNFKNFSCSTTRGSLKSIRSAQEGVDNLMQRMTQLLFSNCFPMQTLFSFLLFFFSCRTIATQHDVGHFSEIGSFVRELFATTVECVIAASAYGACWLLYADDGHRSGNNKWSFAEDQRIRTDAVGFDLLRFELWAKAAVNAYHWQFTRIVAGAAEWGAMARTEIGTIRHSIRCTVAIERAHRYIFAGHTWLRQEGIRAGFYHSVHTWIESISTGEFAKRIHR